MATQNKHVTHIMQFFPVEKLNKPNFRNVNLKKQKEKKKQTQTMKQNFFF